MKNRVLTASDLSHNFHSHSRLASGQWSLAPNKNSEAAESIKRSGESFYREAGEQSELARRDPCQIPDFSSCFGIMGFIC